MIDDALNVLDISDSSALAFQQRPSVSSDLCTYQRLTFFLYYTCCLAEIGQGSPLRPNDQVDTIYRDHNIKASLILT